MMVLARGRLLIAEGTPQAIRDNAQGAARCILGSGSVR
jgi:hypothetical protein